MPADGLLTHLYASLLPKDRIWTPEIIDEMDSLQQKINMFNKMASLLRSLNSDKRQRITELDLTESTQKTEEERRAEIIRLKSELDDFGQGAKYKSRDLSGMEIDQEIKEAENLVSGAERYLHLVIESYWSIAEGHSANSIKGSGTQPLYRIIARDATRHQARRLCHNDTTAYSFWNARWKADKALNDEKVWIKTKKLDESCGDWVFEFVSRAKLTDNENEEDHRIEAQWRNVRGRLTDLLFKHGDKLKAVDKILCFGLGALDWRRPKHFVQHLAAATVRDTLHSIREKGGIAAKIPIIAQDPAYCSNCTQVLKRELDIHVVVGNEGFKAVTKNSFIITVAPSAPVCQIIADLTLQDGGPAAMLCDRFGDDYLAREHKPEGEYTCDEPTKNMVEYKKRCTIEDFDEVQGVLGMNYEEFQKFPTLADKLKELGTTIVELNAGKTDENKRQKYDEYRKVTEREATMIFLSSTLYVRVD
ncbi:Nn.00g038530.m01.CDS01 [Neocucurbitaria sp. VM-36]